MLDWSYCFVTYILFIHYTNIYTFTVIYRFYSAGEMCCFPSFICCKRNIKGLSAQSSPLSITDGPEHRWLILAKSNSCWPLSCKWYKSADWVEWGHWSIASVQGLHYIGKKKFVYVVLKCMIYEWEDLLKLF